MAVYDIIPNSEVDIDKPVKSSTAKKFRDNPLAVTQGDPTALAAGEGVAIDFDFGSGPQTAIITDETDTDKSLTPDGAGGAKWTAGVSGMVLVERKEIVAAVTDVTFSGLDGDTDEVYKLIGRIVTTGIAVYTVRPNNLTTNQAGRINENGGTATSADIRIILANALINAVMFEMLIHAREVVQTVTIPRVFTGSALTIDGAPNAIPLLNQFGAMWDGGGNITSLVIHSSIASLIGIGSTFELFKLSQG